MEVSHQLHALAALTRKKKPDTQSFFRCGGNQKIPEPAWN
jgi:hypothetical protein